MKSIFILLSTLMIISLTNAQQIGFIPGKTPVSLRIGDGFSYDNIENHPRLFDPRKFEDTTIDNSAVDFDYFYISKRSDLMKALSLNATLAYKSINAHFESSLEIGNQEMFNSDNLTICLVASANMYYTTFKFPEDTTQLTKNTMNIFNSNSKAEFTRILGDHYVKSISYGAKIYVFLTIMNTSNSSSRKFNLNANGSIGSLSTNVDYANDFKNAESSKDIRVTVKSYGVENEGIDFSKFFEYKGDINIDTFFRQTLREYLSKTPLSKANSVPINYEIAPLEEINLKASARKIAIDEIKMSDYLNAYYEYDDEIRNIDFIRRNPSKTGINNDGIDKLILLRKQLSDEIDIVVKINNNCFDDKNKCPTYSIKNIAFKNSTYYNNIYKLIPVFQDQLGASPAIEKGDTLFKYTWRIDTTLLKLIKGKDIVIKIRGSVKSTDTTYHDPHFQTLFFINGQQQEHDISFDYPGEVKSYNDDIIIKVPDTGIINLRVLNSDSWAGDTINGSTAKKNLRLTPFNFSISFQLPKS